MAEESHVKTKDGNPATIKWTKDLKVVQDYWWDNMLELGWNRSYHDIESILNATSSPGVALLTLPASSEDPKGHFLACTNTNNTAWLALFVVSSSLRRQGYGSLLWDAVMNDISAPRNGQGTGRSTTYVGLDGVAEQKATYERRGFVDSNVGRVKCMQRPLVAKRLLSSLVDESSGNVTMMSAVGTGVVSCKELEMEWLVASEKEWTGIERRKLWTKEFFDREDVLSFALVENQGRNARPEKPHAWVVARRCATGGRIGPLYARDKEAAESVLRRAMEAVTAEWIKKTPLPKVGLSDMPVEEIEAQANLQVEFWGGNPDAVALFSQLGWDSTGVDYHRMWLNGNVPKEQSSGGQAQKSMFAIFDAAIG